MMEVLKDDFTELEMGNSVESLQNFLVSQRELFHSQIDQLEKIVVTQCKLTGVNPLSQEMAAGALSIKIGKRPRDLLNPKAVNYMQLVFSIKDAISKKESREISALFGVTVTQVREFFNSQRSRVRRLVRLSRERVSRSSYCEEPRDGFQIHSDPMIPINPTPLNSSGPSSVEEASCSTPEAALSGLNDLDKHFVDNIFSLMRKEETFSGQEKLMEWILKIHNFSVLCWFLTGGGVMILGAWLNEAAVEEQTSVLLLILKVLCHLPLHKALPTHISAVLQCVNRLRFHRTSDSIHFHCIIVDLMQLVIINLSDLKIRHIKQGKGFVIKVDIGQIMGTESWNSNIDVPEDVLALSNEGSDNFRKLEAPQTVKLLTASSDDSTKKAVLGVSSSRILGETRERRKVQLVEQPGQKTVSRSPQAARVGPASQSRPMSADDIQKAKMRALFMQSKYGKPGSSKGSKEAKIDSLNKPQTNQAGVVASLSKYPVSPKTEEDLKPPLLPSKILNRKEASDSKSRMDLKEPFWEKCKRVQIQWKKPAEVKLNDTWSVGAGENSKEVDVQKNRNRREKETLYQTAQDIPFNPKEPWDLEMDYDDSLTPAIPIEQLPDGDGAETPAAPNQNVQVGTTSSSSNIAEPDLELLAVLLKNPELVFALTSGQAGSIPTEETVKLLDMIKRGSVHLGGSAQEKVEVSLPSPTPSSDPRTVRDLRLDIATICQRSCQYPSTVPPALHFSLVGLYLFLLRVNSTSSIGSGWTTELAKNPFSRQNHDQIQNLPVAATTNVSLSQVPPTGIAVRQHQTDSLSQATNIVPTLSSIHPTTQMSSSNIGLSTMMNTIITANASSARSPLAMQVDGSSNVKPIANLSIQEGLSNSYSQSFVLPSPTPTPSLSVTPPQRNMHSIRQSQQTHFSEPSSYHEPAHSYLPPIEKPGHHVSESWRVRQDMSSRYHSQLNQHNYNAFVEGGSSRSGSSWERSDFGGGEEFESWSPDNSPSRNNRYNGGRNYPDSRMNHGRNYRPEWSRQRGSSVNWDPSRQGSRKWHDQRR
ncbi:homeobox protein LUMINIDEPENDENS [Senna tora]|uniref:Homeobox protein LUMINIDEPENDENS n=1 Tax=Senna tora TaxID=362788 RepID=A0A834SJP7_9FABA|nr:homeobox protein LUMINIDEPENDENS [Senna tora]